MKRRFTGALFIVLLFLPAMNVLGQEAGNRYALLIAGLGGDAEHTEKFKGYLFNTQKALKESFGFSPEHIVILGEAKITEESFVDDLSNAENIRAQFDRLSRQVTSDDDVYIILFGHGGYDAGEARLNIPRRDLNQNDFADLVDTLNPRRLVFINTASASAPFIEALGKEGRIVITATRTGTQKNETSFPRFFVEALTNPAADRDKDGRISVVELFAFSAERTDQMYADNGNIPTENALISDTGATNGARLEEIETAGMGQLAAFTYLSSGDPALIAAAENGNPEVSGWLREKNQIELDIAALKSRKAEMEVDEYYGELELLFVRLARGNEQLEQVP